MKLFFNVNKFWLNHASKVVLQMTEEFARCEMRSTVGP